MRKLKLFMTALTMIVGGGDFVFAQTDVTSTYITNADFEGNYSVFVNPKSDRAIYQPNGWTVTRTGSDTNDMTILKSGDLADNNFSAFTINDATTRGSKTYWTRLRWGNNTGLKLSQTKTLNPGSYTLTALVLNYNNNKSNNKTEVFAGTNSVTASNSNTKNDGAGWKTLTVNFTINDATEMEIGFKLTHATESDGEQIVGVDNFVLTYTDFKAELRAVIAQAQTINARISTLSDEITTAQGVINTADASKSTIDDAVTTLRSAISTKLAAYTGLNAAGDDITSFIVNNGFETSPTFDGTSLGSGSDPKSNATPTAGSTLLFNAKNVYQVNGWELLTTETSDFARTFTMPYDKTIYVWGNNNVAGQAVTSPTNGSSVTTSNDDLLFVEANWCENAELGVKQTLPLPAGSYRLTFDSYVSNAIGNAESRCGVSYGETTGYKWPAALNTWTNNEVDFTLDAQTDVTISMGYKKIGNVGGGSSAHLFIDNVKLTYFDPLKLAQIQWQGVWDALDALDETALPNAAEDAITDALAETEPTTVEGYNTAKAALQALIDSYDGIKAAYDKVNELITFVTGEVTNSTGTKPTIEAAISTATTNIETRTNAEDLTSDYNTLEVARQTYVTSGAQPTAGNSFDWTFKMTNPDFEDGTTGWTNERNTTGQYNYGTTTSAMQHGTKGLDVWSPQINYINVYQNQTLPEGNYELSAYVYSSNPYKQHVYAHNGKDNPSENLTSTSEWQKLTAMFINFEEVSTKLGLYSQGKNVSGNQDGWFRLDNFQLLYKGVTLDDATANALLETVPEGNMQATVESALSNAKTVFESAKTIANYNALKSAIDAANTSIASYTAANTNLTAMKAVVDATNVYTADALNTYYTTPKGKYDARTLTDEEAAALENPSTQTGWHAATTVDNFLLSAWNTAPDFDGENSPYYINTWSTEGNSDGSGMTTPFFEYFVDNGADAKLGERTLTATMTGVAEGNYYVDVLVRVGKNSGEATTATGITLDVNGGTPVDICAGSADAKGRFYGTFRALGTVTADGQLAININVAADNNVHWLAFKNVMYSEFNGATTEQKNALATAIINADGKTLGFENGEFAPYNNIEVLTALADAKALDPEIATASEVTNATAAIGDANWTANSGDVDAVFNGNFSSDVDGDWGLTGWTRTNSWGQQRNDVSGGYGYYNQPGSLKYGDTGVYTMPLKANTIYSLTFKYASWEDNSNNGMTVSVLNSEDGMAAMNFEANKTKYTSGLVTKSLVFVTGAAGNYVLTLANSGNTVITDVSITKAANQYLKFADGSVPTYAPGTYPSVKITRTLNAGLWATAVYPFAVSGVDEIAVLDSYDASTGALSFKSADASEANIPFLMRSTAVTKEISLSNVAVAAAAATDDVKGDASLKGTYTATDIDNTEQNFVLSGNKIYSVGTAGATINPYRAYIQIAESTPARGLTFFVDGEQTAIEGVIAESEQLNGKVYNLNGQQVEKAQKGLYIVNGKKVVLK